MVPQLTGSLNLHFGLKEEGGTSAQIVSIPSSILGPGRRISITISKVNGWPVNTFAKIYPEHAATFEEARPLIADLLQSADIWREASWDVEKVGFVVREDRPLVRGENYWLIVGLEPVAKELIAADTTGASIYKDYAINLRVEVQPWSLVPLMTLLTMTLIVYYGLLRKYHLRLFSLK